MKENLNKNISQEGKEDIHDSFNAGNPDVVGDNVNPFLDIIKLKEDLDKESSEAPDGPEGVIPTPESSSVNKDHNDVVKVGKKVGRGTRKSLSSHTSNNNNVSSDKNLVKIFLSGPEFRKLRFLAYESGQSMSGYLTNVFTQFLSSPEAKSVFDRLKREL